MKRTLLSALLLGSSLLPSVAFAQAGPVTCTTTSPGAHGRGLTCTDGTTRAVSTLPNGELSVTSSTGESTVGDFQGDWVIWTDTATGAQCSTPWVLSVKLDLWPVSCPTMV